MGEEGTKNVFKVGTVAVLALDDIVFAFSLHCRLILGVSLLRDLKHKPHVATALLVMELETQPSHLVVHKYKQVDILLQLIYFKKNN